MSDVKHIKKVKATAQAASAKQTSGTKVSAASAQKGVGCVPASGTPARNS